MQPAPSYTRYPHTCSPAIAASETPSPPVSFAGIGARGISRGGIKRTRTRGKGSQGKRRGLENSSSPIDLQPINWGFSTEVSGFITIQLLRHR